MIRIDDTERLTLSDHRQLIFTEADIFLFYRGVSL